MADKETIAILGGTGDLGTGLAIRWSKAGYRIVIGSRTLEKARNAVADLARISPETPADAMQNPDAAAAGDIVVLTVPAEHQTSTLETDGPASTARSSSTSRYRWCRHGSALSSFRRKAALANAHRRSSATTSWWSPPSRTSPRTC